MGMSDMGVYRVGGEYVSIEKFLYSRGSSFQYRKFTEQPNNMYLIRIKGTELYLTATSDEDNSPVVLMPKKASDKQLWRLI